MGEIEALFFVVVAAAGFGLNMLWRGNTMTTHQRLERAVQCWFGGVGAWLLFAAIGHLFFADQVAESVGWAPGSPFQREIGFSDLA
jgi:hypothetical protein